MRPPIRRLAASAVVVLTVVIGASPAGAQAGEDTVGNLVVVTGRAEVREGETVDTVVVADGPVVIDGTVRDGVIALNGDVTVRGTAEEDVVAIRGRVTIAGSGRVGGDVVSRQRPVVEEGATLAGSWERWDPGAWRRGVAIVGRLAVWLAFTVSTLVLGLLLGLLAPHAATAVDRAGRTNVGAAVGWGLLLTIGLPVAAVVLVVTVLALPLGLAVLFALGLVYTVGYTAGAWLLGRTVVRGGRRAGAFLAGWGILRVLALVPVLGGLLWFAAVVWGLGAIAVAVHRARSAPLGAAPVATPSGGTAF